MDFIPLFILAFPSPWVASLYVLLALTVVFQLAAAAGIAEAFDSKTLTGAFGQSVAPMEAALTLQLFGVLLIGSCRVFGVTFTTLDGMLLAAVAGLVPFTFIFLWDANGQAMRAIDAVGASAQ